jgi:hypothetical protein
MKGFRKNGWEVLAEKLSKARLKKIEEEAAKEMF